MFFHSQLTTTVTLAFLFGTKVRFAVELVIWSDTRFSRVMIAIRYHWYKAVADLGLGQKPII